VDRQQLFQCVEQLFRGRGLVASVEAHGATDAHHRVHRVAFCTREKLPVRQTSQWRFRVAELRPIEFLADSPLTFLLQILYQQLFHLAAHVLSQFTDVRIKFLRSQMEVSVRQFRIEGREHTFQQVSHFFSPLDLEVIQKQLGRVQTRLQRLHGLTEQGKREESQFLFERVEVVFVEKILLSLILLHLALSCVWKQFFDHHARALAAATSRRLLLARFG